MRSDPRYADLLLNCDDAIPWNLHSGLRRTNPPSDAS